MVSMNRATRFRLPERFPDAARPLLGLVIWRIASSSGQQSFKHITSFMTGRDASGRGRVAWPQTELSREVVAHTVVRRSLDQGRGTTLGVWTADEAPSSRTAFTKGALRPPSESDRTVPEWIAVEREARFYEEWARTRHHSTTLQDCLMLGTGTLKVKTKARPRRHPNEGVLRSALGRSPSSAGGEQVPSHIGLPLGPSAYDR